MKIIIDTDPAMGYRFRDVDDNIAVLLALKCAELDVLGLTVTYGNASQRRARHKAIEALRVAGREDIPCLKGASSPFSLGKETPASRFIVDQINREEEEVTLLAIGPLTNVATAFKSDPSIADKVKEVVLMGGSFILPGLDKPAISSEFNFTFDAKATKIVLEKSKKLSIISMNVCTKVLFTWDRRKKLKALDTKEALYIAKGIKHWLAISPFIFKKKGFFPWDVLAVAYLVKPEIFSDYRHLKLSIQTKLKRRGRMKVLDESPEPAEGYAKVPLHADEEAFFDLFYSKMG